MSANTTTAQDALLCSFVISSRELRHIVRAEREVYLRHTSELGPILRGEIPECGATCHANLGQVLLEFALSCEGAVDDPPMAESIDQFGRQLGQALVAHLALPAASGAGHARLVKLFACLIHSLGIRHRVVEQPAQIRFLLDQDPVQFAAAVSGIHRNLRWARQACHALCLGALHAISADWQLGEPGGEAIGDPWAAIALSRT